MTKRERERKVISADHARRSRRRRAAPYIRMGEESGSLAQERNKGREACACGSEGAASVLVSPKKNRLCWWWWALSLTHSKGSYERRDRGVRASYSARERKGCRTVASSLLRWTRVELTWRRGSICFWGGGIYRAEAAPRFLEKRPASRLLVAMLARLLLLLLQRDV